MSFVPFHLESSGVIVCEFSVCGFYKRILSVAILVLGNQEDTLRLGWGSCSDVCVAHVVVSVERGCPATRAVVESHSNHSEC